MDRKPRDLIISLVMILAGLLIAFWSEPLKFLSLTFVGVLGWWLEPVLEKGMMRKKLLLSRLIQLKALQPVKTEFNSEDRATSLGWFIPRKYRNDIIGDILQDCADMRKAGCTERRIKFHVVYQWLIVVVTLVPSAIKTSITDILKQVLSAPK